jgi:hypothetical protein
LQNNADSSYYKFMIYWPQLLNFLRNPSFYYQILFPFFMITISNLCYSLSAQTLPISQRN